MTAPVADPPDQTPVPLPDPDYAPPPALSRVITSLRAGADWKIAATNQTTLSLRLPGGRTLCVFDVTDPAKIGTAISAKAGDKPPVQALWSTLLLTARDRLALYRAASPLYGRLVAERAERSSKRAELAILTLLPQ